MLNSFSPTPKGDKLHCLHEQLFLCLVETMLEVLDVILEKTKGQFLQKEGMLLAKQLLASAKHILDLFTKTITSAVCRGNMPG